MKSYIGIFLAMFICNLATVFLMIQEMTQLFNTFIILDILLFVGFVAYISKSHKKKMDNLEYKIYQYRMIKNVKKMKYLEEV